MKKNSIVRQSPKAEHGSPEGPITIGMDLGDKTSRYCVLGEEGEVVSGRQRGDEQESHEAEVFGDAAVPDRDGSGNAFAVGEPLAGESGI